jgi:hypothetical protein
VFIVDDIKQEFTRSLKSVHDDYLKEKKDLSDSPNTGLMRDLVTAIKTLEITCSIKFIDEVVAQHYQEDDFYLFLRQCVDLVDSAIMNKKTICCGALYFKLNDVESNAREGQLSLPVLSFICQITWLKVLEKVKFLFISAFTIDLSLCFNSSQCTVVFSVGVRQFEHI